jgi:hypothetical protein
MSDIIFIQGVVIMASINFGSTVSLNEFANAIATVGDQVTIIGQGEPGIGKSAMLKFIASKLPNYETAYIDCTLLDLGDFALPYTELASADGSLKVTKFAPNARFKFQSNKPVIVMLDEIGKAMKAVKNVLLTLMLEKRIGDVQLPEGSIVFGTTNLSTDGVGDSLEAHARNRVCFVTVRKPHAGFNGDGSVDSDSWGAWALDNDIAPEIIAWVKQFPQSLESYTDKAQSDNPYIFNPTRAGQTAFVTPRSLEKASHIAKKRPMLGESVTISALAGTIGESAARDMQAFFTVVDKLPTWDAIMQSPDTAKVPDDAVAKCILVFSAISRVEKDTMGKWLRYAERLEKELQALFARSVVKSSTKQAMAVSNKDFVSWATTNQWLF